MIAAMLTSLPDALGLLILGSVLILCGVLLRRVVASLKTGSELSPEENAGSKYASENEEGFVRPPLAAASHDPSVLAGTLERFSLARPN